MTTAGHATRQLMGVSENWLVDWRLELTEHGETGPKWNVFKLQTCQTNTSKQRTWTFIVHSPPIPDTSPLAECSRPGNFEQLISIFINSIFFWSIISQQKNSNKGTRRHFGFRIIYYSFERKSLGKRLNAGFRLNAFKRRLSFKRVHTCCCRCRCCCCDEPHS